MAGKKTPKKTTEISESRFTIKVAGKEFTLDAERVTGKIDRQLKLATGYRVASAMAELEHDPGADLIATLCYAASLQAGLDPDLDELDELVTLTDIEIDFGDDKDDDGDDSPED